MEALDNTIKTLEQSPLKLIKQEAPDTNSKKSSKPEALVVTTMPTMIPSPGQNNATASSAVKIAPLRITTTTSDRVSPVPTSLSDSSAKKTSSSTQKTATTLMHVDSVGSKTVPPKAALPKAPQNFPDFAGLLGQLDSLTSFVESQTFTKASSEPKNSTDVKANLDDLNRASKKEAILTSYFMKNLTDAANGNLTDEDKMDFESLLLEFSDPKSQQYLSSSEKEKARPQVEEEPVVCPGCKEKFQVGDTYIAALGKRWHESHLTCCVCKVGLNNVFFEENGQVYCEQHHLEKSLSKCAFCNEFIKERCVNALGQTFHPEHFFCSQCGVPFNESGYRTFEGKAYCEADYIAFFAPMCAACSKPIVSSTINALNKTFHVECFVCQDCKKPFRNNAYFPLDQMPYCEFHFHKRNGTLCPICDKPILGKFMEALGKKWHIEHFVCQSCETSLTTVPFKDISGKPYCIGCYNRFYVQ